jgi:hypothetical protein
MESRARVTISHIRTAQGVTSTSLLNPARAPYTLRQTVLTWSHMITQIIVKSYNKVLCLKCIRDEKKKKKKRLARDCSKILRISSPEYTLRANPSGGCGKLIDHQQTCAISRILEHQSCHQWTNKNRVVKYESLEKHQTLVGPLPRKI